MIDPNDVKREPKQKPADAIDKIVDSLEKDIDRSIHQNDFYQFSSTYQTSFNGKECNVLGEDVAREAKRRYERNGFNVEQSESRTDCITPGYQWVHQNLKIDPKNR